MVSSQSIVTKVLRALQLRHVRVLACAAAGITALSFTVTPAQAGDVGAIFACYACQATGDTAIDASLSANPNVAYDGLLFAFQNTSGAAITDATFNVSTGAYTDTFSLPTIAANAEIIFLPGLSSDGGTHPTNSLFYDAGRTADTSDGDGGVSDTSTFWFAGLSNGLAVKSGPITAGDPSLIKPYRDNPAAGSTSFLGNGPNGDTGCNNCYYAQIANLSVPDVVSGAPEPDVWGLAFLAVGLTGLTLRRSRRFDRGRTTI